ncbi:MAG: hypothetical protein GQ561_09430 [Calditrichae bacterium]|nr:hypothetical protein [Calditrichia bacterium]
MGSIVKGLQNTWQLKKLIVVLWAVNFLLAGLFLIPYCETFRDFFSNRLVTDILANHNIYSYYAEFYHHMNSAVSYSRSWIQLGNLIHYLLIILLTGGFISALVLKKTINLKEFWKDCLHFRWRMIQIGLITPVLLGILFLVGLFTGFLFSFLLPDYFVEEQYFYFLILLSVFILILILAGWLVLDLAKIRIIEGKDRNVGHSLIEAFRLFVDHPIGFFGSYLVIFVLWLIFVMAYWLLQHHLSDRSPGGILLELVVLQASIWGQIWIRFSRYDVLFQLLQKNEKELRKSNAELWAKE